MNNILALDQASRTSGWAVFQDGSLIASGTFTVTDADLGQRLLKIKNYVVSLINQYNINKVYFEDIQLQNNKINNVQTFKILAEVFGVIYETLTELEMPHEIVFSGTWKSALGIKGANRDIQKKNAQAYVLQTYQKKVSQDESDAICIGAYAVKNPIITIEEDFDWSD